MGVGGVIRCGYLGEEGLDCGVDLGEYLMVEFVVVLHWACFFGLIRELSCRSVCPRMTPARLN